MSDEARPGADAPLELSPSATLIVPVAREALGSLAERDSLAIDEVTLVRKAEHHVTVFGFAIGKPLKKLVAANASLREAIDAAIAGHDFAIRPGRELFHLVRTNDRGTLHTLIVLVEADVASLFERVRDLVRAHVPDAEATLAALAEVPPPHVTVYTSDPAGKDGIGLKTREELDAALSRAATDPGLVARPVAASVLHAAATPPAP